MNATGYTQWITNTFKKDAGETVKELKASKDWEGVKLTIKAPKATEHLTEQHLINRGLVGIYAESDSPVMKEAEKLNIQEKELTKELLKRE